MTVQNTDQLNHSAPKKVSIASVSNCPAIETHLVQVLYRRSGINSLQTIAMKRPTRFDELVTVVVEEISPPPNLPPAPIRSTTDILRRIRNESLHVGARFGPPVLFDEPVLDTRRYEPNNVAHLVNCLIPMCLQAKKSIGRDVLMVCRRLKLARARELLEKFDITPIETHKRISGPVVHIRGTRGLAVFNLPPFDDDMISFFPHTYDGYSFQSRIKHEKIFLARRDSRALDNQSEVENVLGSAGYKTVYMEDHSIEEQIGIAANARHVVAVHGAAMGFLTFNRAIDTVIELSPPHVYHEYFAVTLGNRVRNYILVIQDFDERVVHTGWHAISHFKNQPFTADIALLRRALSLSHS
jgi:hypothetical protein